MKKGTLNFILSNVLVLSACNVQNQIPTTIEKPQQKFEMSDRPALFNFPTFKREDGLEIFSFENTYYLFNPSTRQLLHSGSSSPDNIIRKPPKTLLEIPNDYARRMLLNQEEGKVYLKK